MFIVRNCVQFVGTVTAKYDNIMTFSEEVQKSILVTIRLNQRKLKKLYFFASKNMTSIVFCHHSVVC